MMKHECPETAFPPRTLKGFHPLAQGWMRRVAGTAAYPGCSSHKYFPPPRPPYSNRLSHPIRGGARGGASITRSTHFYSSNQLYRSGGGEGWDEGETPFRASGQFHNLQPSTFNLQLILGLWVLFLAL